MTVAKCRDDLIFEPESVVAADAVAVTAELIVGGLVGA